MYFKVMRDIYLFVQIKKKELTISIIYVIIVMQTDPLNI